MFRPRTSSYRYARRQPECHPYASSGCVMERKVCQGRVKFPFCMTVVLLKKSCQIIWFHCFNCIVQQQTFNINFTTSTPQHRQPWHGHSPTCIEIYVKRKLQNLRKNKNIYRTMCNKSSFTANGSEVFTKLDCATRLEHPIEKKIYA